VALVALLAIIVAFPQLATWLPGFMKYGRTDDSKPIEKGVDELRACSAIGCAGLKPRVREGAALPQGLRRTPRRPGDLKDLADLAKFRSTTKADLRATIPRHVRGTDGRYRGVHASSGTPQAHRRRYTREDIDTWSSVMARSIRAAAAVPPTSFISLTPPFTGGLGAHYGA